MKKLTTSCLVLILLCIPFSQVHAQKIDKDIFGLQEILIDMERDLITRKNNAILGKLDPSNFNFNDESIPANGMCLANAFDLCKANVNHFYFWKGATKSMEMTIELFGGVAGKFKLDKVADLAKMLIEAEDSDQFVELMAKYAVEKAIDKGTGAVGDVFKEKVDASWSEPFADKLTDEAKSQLTDAFKESFFPDSEQEIFKNTYDPGLGILEKLNPLDDSKYCPVKMTAYHTKDKWSDADGNPITYPTLKVVFTGNCNCKYPKYGAGNEKIEDFEIVMYIKLGYTQYIKKSLGFTGFSYDTLSRFDMLDTYHDVDLTCCSGENIAYEDPTGGSFTDQGDVLVGTNSCISFEHYDGENTFGLMAGATAQIFVANQLSVGLNAAYLLQLSKNPSQFKNSTNGMMFKPNLNYFVPIAKDGKIYFVPSFGVPISIAKQNTANPAGQRVNELIAKSFGAEIAAGFAFEVPAFMVLVQCPIFAYNREIFSDPNGFGSFKAHKVNTALNKGLFSFSFLWDLNKEKEEYEGEVY